MSTTPVTLDLSTATPINAPTVTPQSQALAGAVSYAAQQKPDGYAKLLRFQQLTGVPPVVSQGNEDAVQQQVDANKLDPHQFSATNPRVTGWASNPDNAAVSGVDELHRLGGVEQNAAGMRQPQQSSILQEFWDALKDVVSHPLETLVGADTPKQAAEKAALMKQAAETSGNAFMRTAVRAQEESEKPLLSVSGTQRFQQLLDPKSQNVVSRIVTGVVKGAESLTSPTNLGLLASLPLAPESAAPLVSGAFGTQMAEGAATGAVQAGQAVAAGQYGDAAELAAGAATSAYFAKTSFGHALTGRIAGEVAAAEPQAAPSSVPPEFAPQFQASPFLSQVATAVDATAYSALRERSPEKFYEANQTIFDGDESIRIPADRFAEHFTGKGSSPQAVAGEFGAGNYAEAVLSGGDVEVPKASFFGRMDPEDQKALLPDVVDPTSGLTARQHSEGVQQLRDWTTGGGADQLLTETAAADAETAATTEHQAVREELRQRYVDAGEQPDVAETLADKDAAVYGNLAREAGLKPDELLRLYNPKVVSGDAPASPVLYQGGAGEGAAPEGTRGWFRANADGSYEIGKTDIGDLSTFVHEPAHAYLHILSDLAKRDGASDVLKQDHAKILEFLGAKDGEPLTREQQETWARANEQYLREGKAPNTGLRGTFQRLAVWLGSVYKKASDLGVTLSDDIREVFGRLYAAESSVDRSAAEAGPHLFATPEEAGWTEEEYQKYAAANDVSVEQAKSHVMRLLNEAALRDRTQAWRDEERETRSAVTTEVDQRPEYAAIRALRRGTLDDGDAISMSREALVQQFGEERVKALQKAHPGLYRVEGGLDPETAAEMLGYTSADGMLKALEAAPRRSAAIDQATRAFMTAKHGDIRYDGSLQDQARLAVENDKRAEVLHQELSALKRKLVAAGEKDQARRAAMRDIGTAPLSAYREAAAQMIEAKAPADLNPTRYLDSSRKYSREAFEALRKGDAQKAIDAKHKELMNHFLFRSATEAKEYVGKFESYAKRMQSKGVQGKLGLAGADYQSQFNNLLARYGLGQATEQPERSLTQWALDLFDRGSEPAIDEAILNEARRVNYRNAAIAEIRQLHDALVNIRKLASQELEIEVNGRKVEFGAAIGRMEATAFENLRAKPNRVLKKNLTLSERAGDLAQRGDALLMRTERLMEWLDGGKEGAWHDNLWHLAADAQGAEYKLQEEVTKALGDALDRMPKEQRRRMLEKVTVDGIGETVTRHDLVSMAFNMGNDGNLDRLQKTFAAHGWDVGSIDKIKGLLTREEWQFVQDGWNSLKPLGQAQFELERRLTGLAPVMVKPTPFRVELADGSNMDLDGGYYPITMDPRFSSRGATQDAGSTAQNLMEAGYARASTSRGAMKERTGFGGPLQLDYEQVLSQHTAKVIKDITHREFMLAANKLLLDPTIRNTLRSTLGEGYEEKMLPWLRSIVNDRNGSSTQGLGDFSRLMRSLRTNLTLATLSFKVSTSLLQWTHAPRMLLSTRPAAYAQAMVDFLAHPVEMTRQIKELSPNEMMFRGENLDRDIRGVLRGSPGIAKKVAEVGNISIKYTDHVLSFPLWLSVYRDALVKHVDLDETEAQYRASHEADSAVRLGLGSGAPKDLPPIMRNNDLSKFLTMFYSFHNGIYGQIRDIAHQTQGWKDAPKLTYGLALSVLVPSVLSAIVSGHGPKDDQNPAVWAAQRALLFGGDTVPLLRDVSAAIDGDGDVKLNPLINVMSKGAKAGKRAFADTDDKDWTGIGLDSLEVMGDLSGVPGTTQTMKPIRYARQVDKGNVENPNVYDAIAGSAHK